MMENYVFYQETYSIRKDYKLFFSSLTGKQSPGCIAGGSRKFYFENGCRVSLA